MMLAHNTQLGFADLSPDDFAHQFTEKFV